jgi:hypothetical protein
MKRIVTLLSLLFFIVFSPSILRGTTYTWLGNVGNWNDATQWDLGLVPSSTDDIKINQGSVTLTSNVTLNSIELNGGTVTGNYNILVTTFFEQKGGTLSGTGSCTIAGIFRTLPISGSTSATITIKDKNIIMNGGGSFSNTTLFVSGGNSFTLAPNQIITWYSNVSAYTGCFRLNTGDLPSLFLLQIGSIFEKTGLNSVYLDHFNFTNQGTIKVAASSSILWLGYSSNSSQHVGGKFDIGSNSEIIINGGTHNLSNCNISGLGRFTSGQNNPVLNMDNTTIFSSQTNATCWFNTTWNWTNFNATFNSLRVAGAINGSGNITVNNYMDMDGSPFYNVAGTVTVGGNFNINFGTCIMAGIGILTINNDMNINVGSGSTSPVILNLLRQTILKGNINAVNALGRLNIRSNLSLQNTTAKSAYGSGSIYVSGIFEKVTPPNFTIANPLTIENTGYFRTYFGDIYLNGLTTNNGTLQSTIGGKIILGNTC